ncbi:MAG: metallophosphoesterase [Ignavibacteria bacterium]|nr:metallophosphoesterase [Ignavibacteria bacterium]
MKNFLLIILLFVFSNYNYSQVFKWSQLPNSPVPDTTSLRFEDIYFSDANTGWIAMYTGAVYKTTNGGNTWSNTFTASNYPFAKYRSLGFFNSQFGLLGTLNSVFPLMRTTNGGLNWTNVTNIPNPVPYGICGISIVNEDIAYGVGRYAAPANVIKTTDRGATWSSITMDGSLVRSLVDCYFWSPDSGIVVGGFNTSGYQNGNAVVLKTVDGGITWQRKYISSRTGEWCWKISFVSKTTGYVSIERHSGFAYILKTTNTGETWTEIPFMTYDEEGIGFINENTGWIGGWSGPTYETTNGGSTWTQADWGYYVNRFRFINDTLAYSVGARVYKYLRDTNFLPLARFAAIGDYGYDGPNELAVANLVKSWNPDFVITLGNNNYENGEQSTIDVNIGQHYSQFIHPYYGSFGSGDTVNRYFPSLGNRDWLTAGAAPYLDYFTLPGNERYYDFIRGNVHFFVIDSDGNEPDGIDSSSVQAQWLKTQLAESTETFNIVYFHHPPYSSGTLYGSQLTMRWPFKDWGASAVLSGHEDNYERLLINQLPYFVNGLGGKGINSFTTPPISGSQARYNGNYGAMLVEAYEKYMIFKFYNITNNQIDYYKLLPSSKQITLNCLIQGYYSVETNSTRGDLISVYLHNGESPYNILDSAKGFLSQFGQSVMSFANMQNGKEVYLAVKHRNSLETWSSHKLKFSANKMFYDFTTSDTTAYGNNLVLKGTKYCIYSGDVNQDGIIDAGDQSEIENSVITGNTGNIQFDITGDFYVDASDLSLIGNNVEITPFLQKP